MAHNDAFAKDVKKGGKKAKPPKIQPNLLSDKVIEFLLKYLQSSKNKHAHGGTVYRGRKYNYGGRVAKWHK